MLRRATAAAACTATLIALAPIPATALTGPVEEMVIASGTMPGAGPTVDATVTVRTSGTTSSSTPAAGDTLGAGEELAPGASLAVADGSVTFVMQADGNAVLYAHDGNGPGGGPTPLFHTGTHGSPGARLVLQEDGNVVVYSAQGQPLWQSGTAGTRADTLQVVDGRLLLTGPSGVVAWHTTIGPFSGVVNDGLESVVLRGGDTLCNLGDANYWGRYCLVVQGDGNVVLYSDRGAALWSTGTSQPGSVLAFQTDGNLVVYGPRGQALWEAGTADQPVWRWTMQDDGNLVAYAEDGTPVWSTGTETSCRY